MDRRMWQLLVKRENMEEGNIYASSLQLRVLWQKGIVTCF